jgi:uncharacterized membrane protein
MAGVGFELKKLFQNRTAAGHIRAYSYSAMITAGPFALMTGMVLAIQIMFSSFGVGSDMSQLYLASVVYAFVFSQILSSGFTMVVTRYIADCLSVGQYRSISASLFGLGSILISLGGIVAAVFYWNKPLDLCTKIFAYLFFAQLMMIWLEGVYLSALKKFKRLILSYVAGVAVSILLTWLFLKTEWLNPVQGALLAMDIGTGIILLLFLIQIVQHFGMGRLGMNFAFLPYFERHWRLFFISMSYTVGLFLPNILIWQGDWSIVVADTYRFAPIYDVVTFYAFLSILPLMTMFVVSMETNFYERYSTYFCYITQKGNFREIDDARKDLLQILWFELRQIIEFQLVFSLVFLALGNYMLSWSGITYSQVNMYNVLLFATFFTGVLQLLMILLLYFDYQKDAIKMAALFVSSNFIFGLIGLLWWGDKSYGFTFFLAASLSLLYGFMRLNHFCSRINYYIFCAQPVFYRPPHGLLTRLAKLLYRERLVDLERGEELMK